MWFYCGFHGFALFLSCLVFLGFKVIFQPFRVLRLLRFGSCVLFLLLSSRPKRGFLGVILLGKSTAKTINFWALRLLGSLGDCSLLG